RLLRERARGGASALGLQSLELLRERPLARRDRAQLLEHRLTARAHHGQQPARLAVQPLLVARHTGELLDRFREPAPRLRARDLAAAPREGERRGVERVHGLFRQRPGLSGVRLSLLQLLARRRHLALRKAERALELRRDERVLPRRLADLPLHRRRPLLDRRLARPRRGTARAAPAAPRGAPPAAAPPPPRTARRRAGRPARRTRRPAASRPAPAARPVAAPRATPPSRTATRGPSPPARCRAPASPPALRARAPAPPPRCPGAAHPTRSIRPGAASGLPRRPRAKPAHP